MINPRTAEERSRTGAQQQLEHVRALAALQHGVDRRVALFVAEAEVDGSIHHPEDRLQGLRSRHSAAKRSRASRRDVELKRPEPGAAAA